MKKKLLALMLSSVMALSLVACGGTQSGGEQQEQSGNQEQTQQGDVFKAGVVLIGDENEGYSYAHIEGIRNAMKALNLTDDQVTWYFTIPEDETSYDKCVDLAEAGCDIVFTNSYGHQSYAQQAAEEYPDVQFVSVTGDTALLADLDNFSNAFTAVYESRYVSGVVAGMKIKELVNAGKLSDKNYTANGNVKVGYVGAYPYAEVKSGYTAFFLGIQSIYPNVEMDVSFTNSWSSITDEQTTAESLINRGCVIIGQHADTTGAPMACEAANKAGTVVYSVGYNIDMLAAAPTAALTSAQNNWEVYYTYAMQKVMNGEKVDTNWAKGYSDGAVKISRLGPSCAAGTEEAVKEAESALRNGTLHVFDTSKFTVDGEKVTSFKAVDTDGDFAGDLTEVVFDGYFHESYAQAAPAFALDIDGINLLN